MKKEILIGIIIGLIFFGIGYYSGYVSALNWGVKTAIEVLEIDTDLSSQIIALGIYQYQNRINECLFVKNASIFYKQGNEMA